MKHLNVEISTDLMLYLKERSKIEKKFLSLIVSEMIQRDKEYHDAIEKQALNELIKEK